MLSFLFRSKAGITSSNKWLHKVRSEGKVVVEAGRKDRAVESTGLVLQRKGVAKSGGSNGC